MDARDDSRQYTLKDFAYESTPDKSILAGDGQVNVGLVKRDSKNHDGVQYSLKIYIK